MCVCVCLMGAMHGGWSDQSGEDQKLDTAATMRVELTHLEDK